MQLQKRFTHRVVAFSALALVALTLQGCLGAGVVSLPAKSCKSKKFSQKSGPTQEANALNIVNGDLANKADMLELSTVALTVSHSLSNNAVTSSLCTAVVAAKNILLTAAHCFALPAAQNLPAGVTVTSSSSKVFLANKVQNAPKDFERPVAAFRAHPSFNGSNNDIALVQIASPVAEQFYVPTFLSSSATLTNNTPVTLIGYGITADDAKDAGTKRRTDSFIMNFINSTNYPMTRIENQIRVVDSSGMKRQSCHGDSGGPGFLKDKATVFGIVQGVNLTVQTSLLCDNGDVNYTLLAPFISWIETEGKFKLNISASPLPSKFAAVGDLNGSATPMPASMPSSPVAVASPSDDISTSPSSKSTKSAPVTVADSNPALPNGPQGSTNSIEKISTFDACQ